MNFSASLLLTLGVVVHSKMISEFKEVDMGLCICRDWLFKERSSFTPERDPAEDSTNPRTDRFYLFLSSLPSASAATTSSQPSSQPAINPAPPVDEERGQEISYNKISVREPLSKVLAERAILEHHYNEVDGEAESCFYEEIAGATNSSVTSTTDENKIGRQSSDEADVINDPGYEVLNCHQHKSEPCYAVIDKINSPSDDYSEASTTHKPTERRPSDEEDDLIADPGYEVVNFPQKSEPFYSVINKVTSPGDDYSEASTAHKPLERRPSIDEDDLIADPGYEVVNFPHKAEPFYSLINKIANSGDDYSEASAPHKSTDEEDDLLADPGYEVVNFSKKTEPFYAVVNKVTNSTQQLSQQSDSSKAPCKNLETSNSSDETDNVLNEPGYEVLKCHQQKSEPYYSVINKLNNGGSNL